MGTNGMHDQYSLTFADDLLQNDTWCIWCLILQVNFSWKILLIALKI